MTIISILTAFALCHFVRELGRLRRYEWLTGYTGLCQDKLKKLPDFVTFLIILCLPLIVLGLINGVLTSLLGGIGGFLLALVVLVYTFGPRDLDTDVNRVIAAQDDAEQTEALSELLDGPVPEEEDACQQQAVESVFREALRRWFGVIFWFAVLGIYGALLYRLAVWMTERRCELDQQQHELFTRLRQVLDWPVAQLMTLSLAIATDFDSVYIAWKRFHDEQGNGLFDTASGFLLVSAHTIVLSGHAARDGYADQLTGPLAALQQAMDLVWRILGVWLFVLALLLLVDVIA
jgi:AmpE protein